MSKSSPTTIVTNSNLLHLCIEWAETRIAGTALIPSTLLAIVRDTSDLLDPSMFDPSRSIFIDNATAESLFESLDRHMREHVIIYISRLFPDPKEE